MSYPSNSFNEEKSYLDDYSHIFEECLPLDENVDSIKKEKSYNSNKTNKSTKFIITKKGTRKSKGDDILKKHKAKFHKKLRNDLNDKLIKAGSEKTFESFPQFFITDVTKETNYSLMNLKYGELFEYIHKKLSNDNESNKIKKVDKVKDIKNQETLEYLSCHPEISELSGWNKIKETKYADLLKDFFKSEEFEQSVIALNKNETRDYIELYKYFAENYVDYFLSYNQKKPFKINEPPKHEPFTIVNDATNNIFNMSNVVQSSPFKMNEDIDIFDNMISSLNYDLIENNI